MKSLSLSLLGPLLLGFLALPAPALASSSSSAPSMQACKDTIVKELSAEHDLYRAHLFGTYPGMAEKRSSSSTSSSSSSVSSPPQFIVRTGGMVSSSESGILAIPGRLSSELIAPAIESYRVYRCRSRAICDVMQQSFAKTSGTASSVSIQPLGCAPVDLQTYPSCMFATGNPQATVNDIPLLTDYCNQIVASTLTHEQAVLKVTFAYDSSYRSIFQYAGIVQAMLKDVPAVLFEPLKQAIQLLGSFSRIPCFIGQCDAPALSTR